MKHYKWLNTLLVAIILAACTTNTVTVTSTLPSTATPTLKVESTLPPPTATISVVFGSIARKHVTALSQDIGPRVAGSSSEEKAGQYIKLAFEKIGYKVEVQSFKAGEITSANMVAVKKGKSADEIIVGAHYDSVDVGRGADDNASGIGVLLEVAERVFTKDNPYTIRFIAFGAEELEYEGSKYYVALMSSDQIVDTINMINMDSLAAGDIAYIYGDEGEKGLIRDWGLNFAKENGLKLQTQTGENPVYPAGSTGDWSDHVPFKAADIPYTYFESTNWLLGAKDGYTQVDPKYGINGEIWHTEYDTLEYIDKTFPGRMDERLSLFSNLLFNILTEFTLPK
jgi:alkaline phosphatase isozyme conversion protein